MSEAASGSADGERWLPVVGYEGLYEVSDQGRVRSLDRVDSVGRSLTGRVLRPALLGGQSKYWAIGLSRAGQTKQRAIHHLVAESFIGPRPDDATVVRHLDDDRSNNTPGNLAYGTHSDNRIDSVRNGTHWIAGRTHCARGHEYVGGNLTYRSDRGNTYRVCESCRLARVKHLTAEDQIELSDLIYRRITNGK